MLRVRLRVSQSDIMVCRGSGKGMQACRTTGLKVLRVEATAEGLGARHFGSLYGSSGRRKPCGWGLRGFFKAWGVATQNSVQQQEDLLSFKNRVL